MENNQFIEDNHLIKRDFWLEWNRETKYSFVLEPEHKELIDKLLNKALLLQHEHDKKVMIEGIEKVQYHKAEDVLGNEIQLIRKDKAIEIIKGK